MLLCASPALADGEKAEAEWTIMFYMCGSDLESRYSFATQNLEEIAKCEYPHSEFDNILQIYDALAEERHAKASSRVNVLIETGGCKEWHIQKLGMDVSASAL